MYIVPSTETHFFSGDGRGGGGGRLFEGGRLLQILNLRRGANSKRGAYLKLGANSSIYGTHYAEILEVEPRWFERGVKEAIYIRTLCPSLNKDGGCHNLHPIWTNLLRNRGRGAARKPSNFPPTSEDDVTNNTSHVTKSSGELESL